MDLRLQEAVEKLVTDLVAGAYEQLVVDGRAGRLSAAELESAVRDYGRTLVALPPGAWAFVEEYPQVADVDAVALDVPLWTEEEGRSDLTLSVSARRLGTGFAVAVDDLHVL